ncbi:hypothetical protein GFY24_01685 [Nocardia sp. SYP-A9097]|nr:hypothetical protein [Nocardia sp. SYP-A9097]
MIIDPAKTIGEYAYYKIGGAMIGMTGDPITPAGRVRAQQGIDQMDKAPSELETLLAASAFIFPQSSSARVGATTLRSADVALAKMTALESRSLIARAGTSISRSGDVFLGATRLALDTHVIPIFENVSYASGIGMASTRSSVTAAIDATASASRRGLTNMKSGAQDLMQDVVVWMSGYPRAAVISGGRDLTRANERWVAPRFDVRRGPVTGGVNKPPVTPPVGPVQIRAPRTHVIRFHYGVNPGVQGKELIFRTQVPDQIAGINRMTANQVLHNFATAKRSKTVQNHARALYRQIAVQRELRIAAKMSLANRQGLTPIAYAEDVVDKRMAGMAALHEPDLAGGGADIIPIGADGLPKLGDAGVNSSIGSQWRGKRSRQLKAYAKQLVADGHGDYLMNVQWILR